MARIVVGQRVFESVSPSAYAEAEFENMLGERGQLLFPEYHLLPFKTTVYSPVGSAQADFALIERKYRSWWVVEVEMATHSLSGHVYPQVSALASARYGAPEAAYLAARSAALDEARLVDMMKGVQPRVLVIVNALMPAWAEALRNLNAELAVAEIFRTTDNAHLVRLNGYYPDVNEGVVSICSSDPLFPRLLIVHSPAGLPVGTGEALTIEYESALTEWTRIDVADRVWLSPTRSSPVLPKINLRLVERSSGRLALQQNL